MKNSWNSHYNKLNERQLQPSSTLQKALSLFKEAEPGKKNALDLGCGTGIDTLELLRKNWKVTAIDTQPNALNQLKQNAFPFFDFRLQLIYNSFEGIDFPSVNLINASFSLPFCKPINFEDMWANITNAIQKEGRFAGHFFGVNDSWATNSKMTFLNEKQVLHLFDSFTVEWMEECEKDGNTIGGKKKHWHVFHVVAKKN
jgi:tellurite methyltransferase